MNDGDIIFLLFITLFTLGEVFLTNAVTVFNGQNLPMDPGISAIWWAVPGVVLIGIALGILYVAYNSDSKYELTLEKYNVALKKIEE
ncbi:MAG: hypothetical protein ABEK04_05610 [Candidatus Nanohalobium sp.]